MLDAPLIVFARRYLSRLAAIPAFDLYPVGRNTVKTADVNGNSSFLANPGRQFRALRRDPFHYPQFVAEYVRYVAKVALALPVTLQDDVAAQPQPPGEGIERAAESNEA